MRNATDIARKVPMPTCMNKGCVVVHRQKDCHISAPRNFIDSKFSVPVVQNSLFPCLTYPVLVIYKGLQHQDVKGEAVMNLMRILDSAGTRILRLSRRVKLNE